MTRARGRYTISVLRHISIGFVAAAIAALLSSAVTAVETPNFEKQLAQQRATDSRWRAASDGYMRMEKISYRSNAGDLDIPAFVFLPLGPTSPGGHPALVWV